MVIPLPTASECIVILSVTITYWLKPASGNKSIGPLWSRVFRGLRKRVRLEQKPSGVGHTGAQGSLFLTPAHLLSYLVQTPTPCTLEAHGGAVLGRGHAQVQWGLGGREISGLSLTALLPKEGTFSP